jgi:antitoxin StbD
MPITILAETAASIAELKKDPFGTVAAGDGFPVAILDHNEPAFYCIPAKAYEALMDKLEDVELAAIVEARKNQPEIEVDWDDLLIVAIGKRERNEVYKTAAKRL